MKHAMSFTLILSITVLALAGSAFAVDPLFDTAVHYGVGDHPSSVSSADLDGDNDNDLAVANANSDDVSILLNLTNTPYICGDVDGSGLINVGDMVYLIEYLFFGGPPPPVTEAADMDGCAGVNVADVTYLIEYIFFGGPVPQCGGSTCPRPVSGTITLDNMTGLFAGDSVIMGQSVRWNFRWTYTPGDGSTIAGSTNGFEVYTHLGGAYTDNFTAITYDSFPWGWPSLYDVTGGLVLSDFSVDGVGADTVGFGGAKLGGPGIVDGTDALCWWIATTPSANGDTLCIDSAFYLPGGEWLWARIPFGTLSPGWSGPHCFHVHDTTASLPTCCNGDGMRGDVDGDASITVADVVWLVDYVFFGGPPPVCEDDPGVFPEADADGDGSPTVADVVWLVDYVFFGGPAPLPCP